MLPTHSEQRAGGRASGIHAPDCGARASGKRKYSCRAMAVHRRCLSTTSMVRSNVSTSNGSLYAYVG
eukprot:4944681-Heterocapsa_arctica.AAC.1